MNEKKTHKDFTQQHPCLEAQNQVQIPVVRNIPNYLSCKFLMQLIEYRTEVS